MAFCGFPEPSIFKFTTTGTLTVVQIWSYEISPKSGLTLGTDGVLYGIATEVELNNDFSVVYRFFPEHSPTVALQPGNWMVSTKAGNKATVRVLARGGNLHYQWRKDGVPVSDCPDIFGANAPEMVLSNLTAAAQGLYDVVITNSSGAITSSVVQVEVADPHISQGPASKTVVAGTNATFSVTAFGVAPLNFQWRKDGSDISGAMQSSFTLTNVAASDAGSYSVVVSNAAGSVTSNPATLSPNVPPSIAFHPQSQTKNEGDSVTFTVAASGTTPMTYQWMKEGSAIPGRQAPVIRFRVCSYLMPAIFQLKCPMWLEASRVHRQR